jgi:diadenosine tetraphosphatase ApaH/serine/threonine PP2A family protein phosphatase
MPNENARLYVIGDIHGRLDLLDQLIDAIKRDVGQVASDCLTVTLGDYIDRGPDSRGVIERLLANPFPTPYIALKGNHELLLESFLVDPVVAEHWRRFGAAETLHSYGVPVSGLMAGKAYEEAAAGLRDAMPAQHTRFLRSLRTSYSNDKYFFCHAGVRPGVSLEEQSDEDLLWIRGEFLNSPIDFGKVVVHGHTPVKEPEVLPNRINIDTGAFATGHLTCVVLDKGGHRFIET